MNNLVHTAAYNKERKSKLPPSSISPLTQKASSSSKSFVSNERDRRIKKNRIKIAQSIDSGSKFKDREEYISHIYQTFWESQKNQSHNSSQLEKRLNEKKHSINSLDRNEEALFFLNDTQPESKREPSHLQIPSELLKQTEIQSEDTYQESPILSLQDFVNDREFIQFLKTICIYCQKPTLEDQLQNENLRLFKNLNFLREKFQIFKQNQLKREMIDEEIYKKKLKYLNSNALMQDDECSQLLDDSLMKDKERLVDRPSSRKEHKPPSIHHQSYYHQKENPHSKNYHRFQKEHQNSGKRISEKEFHKYSQKLKDREERSPPRMHPQQQHPHNMKHSQPFEKVFMKNDEMISMYPEGELNLERYLQLQEV
jgi:hypothetical protein